jgi:hypothetical protein
MVLAPPNEVILVFSSRNHAASTVENVITITLYFIRKTASLLRHNGSAAITALQLKGLQSIGR